MVLFSKTIVGRPISKKNSKRMFVRGNRPVLLPSLAFEQFKMDAMYQLMSGGKIATINTPVLVKCEFFTKGRIKADGDNLFTSILDILQDAGILADDDLVMEGVWIKHPGQKEFSTIVTIESSTYGIR